MIIKYINDTLDIIESLAIVFAAGTSIYAINTWKREGLWKKRSDLAEEVLLNCYDVNNKLGEIRSPGSFPSEGKTRLENTNENRIEKEIRNWAYVPIERLNNRREPFLNLEKLKLKCKIYFVPEVLVHIDQILNTQNEIINASRRFARLSIEQEKLISIQLHGNENQERINYLQNQIAEAEAILSEDYFDEDKMKKTVKECISHLEKILLGEINAK
ncbi:MAG TPA: hypothetical protein PLJ00_07890 [Chitinophagales bacterium]|nr:hypothetical protein [Chitinophagales bacterium]HRG27797.1 hypothetical protein [Chitinophagales bacterium]HRG84534.1 hypothetical protein [Chitinophagales bacterium]HRH52751.1 hypothetical protein [Chitinophagales bacterium]